MPPPIPMLDLQAQTAELSDEIQEALGRVIRSGRFILGPEVTAFEREAAEYLNVEHAVGLASGTDALVIGLRALGVGPGDEVITTPFSFFATAEAVAHVGATPVFADIEPDTLCISPAAVEGRITPRTRAILPVHLFGHPADMDALGEIAAARGIPVFEDAAQAFGTELGSRKAGSIGRASAFSFFPSKSLGAFGDGGLLATDDGALADRARLLRNHGQVDRYHYATLGYNSRLDELQAAVLRIKLRRLDRWNELRRERAQAYTDRLSKLDGAMTPCERPGAHHIYHQYTLRVTDGRRDALQEALADAGITSVVYYPMPLHQVPLFQDAGAALPETERASREVLSLPLWPELDLDTIERICDTIARFLETT